MKTVAQAIAERIAAMENCRKSGNAEWLAIHQAGAEKLARDYLPSGSGIDSGTQIDFAKSSAERLTLSTSFHHMDEFGGYDGWTDHTVTIKASLLHDLDLRISGRNRNDIKDYLHEVFRSALMAEVQP